MNNVSISAGTKFYISASLPATYDLATISALTFTQINGIRAIGDIAMTYSVIENRPIGKPARNELGGLESASLPVEIYRFSDAGQALVDVSVKSKTTCSYMLVEPDGTVQYFTAVISSRLKGVGTNKDLRDSRLTLQLNNAIIED